MKFLSLKTYFCVLLLKYVNLKNKQMATIMAWAGTVMPKYNCFYLQSLTVLPR